MSKKKLSIIFNSLIVLFEIIGIIVVIKTNNRLAIEYYTEDSNILALFSSLFSLPNSKYFMCSHPPSDHLLISHHRSATIPAITAAPEIHISIRMLRFFKICGQVCTKGISSAPGITQKLLCPTQSLSITIPSYQFMTSRNRSACR